MAVIFPEGRMSICTGYYTQPFARMLMEEHLGRRLDHNEVVHHIDGDVTNDVITNLQIMTKSEHTKLHNLNRPQEVKDRISKTLRGRPSPKRGRTTPKEVREKISQALQGRIAWNRGIPRSKEVERKRRTSFEKTMSLKRGEVK